MTTIKTPGVYITELNAFPPSIVGVATAVPVFIGYTQTAELDGKAVAFQPVMVTSLAEYEQIFGGAEAARCAIAVAPSSSGDVVAPVWDGKALTNENLTISVAQQSLLYRSMQLFFANGGGNCYVVSVGGFGEQVSRAALEKGLSAAGGQSGITLTVIPDAIQLPADGAKNGIPTSTDYATLTHAMLEQAAALGDRMAIIDTYGSEAIVVAPPARQTSLAAFTDAFYEQVNATNLSYGAVYFPLLKTSVLGPNDIDYRCFKADAASFTLLNQILTACAFEQFPGGASTPDSDSDPHYQAAAGLIAKMASATDAEAAALEQALRAAIPMLSTLEAVVLQKLNVLPPSGAMAGIYTMTDQNKGVWNAPANTSPVMATDVTFHLTDAELAALNVPVNGKAIDAIRYFVGRGPVVWGARTLDGNSNDYRYIQVRRTLIYIEQSIKTALQPFVFAANDGQTWATVTAMIANFLTGVWTQGGLMGAKASEAFNVQCGLGSTMTGQDILDGYMIVQVTLQMIHPAEFIVLSFKQQMQGGA